jgi:arylsulfatase A-like enzyme
MSTPPDTQSKKIRYFRRDFPRMTPIDYGIHMPRSGFSLGAIALACVLSNVASAADRPNFLFLFSDDHRADTLAAWGNSHIDTPSLDALVARGYSFRRTYCMGSPHGAVCVPSRAMVMTGQAFTRVPESLDGVDTLPRRLRDSGYATFITGKWHNEPLSVLEGFSRGNTVMVDAMSNHLEVPLVDIVPNDEIRKRFDNPRWGEGFSTEMFADAAIEFLRDYDDDAPFFCYVAFTAPHDPRMPPEPYREKYYAKRPPLPPNFMPQHPFDNGGLLTRDENLAPWPRPEEMIRDQIAEYYGMIEHLDAHIGRVLDALAASPHADNTYVVFAADHGLAMGSHGLLGKQSVYEHSMRAPLIIAGPGIPHGETQALTYLFDLAPTILDLADAEPLKSIDGLSLAPIWRGDRESVRDVVFLAFERSQRALVESQWKLIRYPLINYTQLFDLTSDPHEMTNLADAPEHADRLATMLQRLAQEQARYGDTAPLSVESPQPKDFDLTGMRGMHDPWQPDWIVDKYFRAPATASAP